MNVSEVSNPVVSNANWIDALISEQGVANWNWLTPTRNTVTYTFNVSAGLAASVDVSNSSTTVFNTAQQAAARQILAYVGTLTGINFAESSSSDADLSLGNCDIRNPDFAGIATARYSYNFNAAGTITSLTLKEYAFLDNREYAAGNSSPTAGTFGYETLLHEIGHTLGLKHPFEGDVTLPSSLDNTSETLMSYNFRGGPYTTFNELDIAALNYLYGRDGIGGSWGVGTGGRYYTGTSGNEAFSAGSGSTAWVGMGGTDSVSFAQAFSSSSVRIDGSWIVVTQGNSTNYVAPDVETLVFPDNTLGYSELLRGLQFSPNTRYGTAAADSLNGTSGNDILFGRGGADSISGLGGVDSALYQGARRDYTVTKTANWTVTDRTVGRDGSDTLLSVERLKFTDVSVALDLDGAAGTGAKVLGALFGREYVQNRDIVGIALGLLDGGMTYQQLAGLGASTALFAGLAGSHSNRDFVSYVYRNLFATSPSAADLTFFANLLDSGAMSQAGLAVIAAETSTNQQNINLAGLQLSGLEYIG